MAFKSFARRRSSQLWPRPASPLIATPPIQGRRQTPDAAPRLSPMRRPPGNLRARSGIPVWTSRSFKTASIPSIVSLRRRRHRRQPWPPLGTPRIAIPLVHGRRRNLGEAPLPSPMRRRRGAAVQVRVSLSGNPVLPTPPAHRALSAPPPSPPALPARSPPWGSKQKASFVCCNCVCCYCLIPPPFPFFPPSPPFLFFLLNFSSLSWPSYGGLYLGCHLLSQRLNRSLGCLPSITASPPRRWLPLRALLDRNMRRWGP